MFPLKRMMNPLGQVSSVSKWYSGAVVAYQPKGAASLAASYVNLANPGTYDAVPGTAPTWNAMNGWSFVTASAQYLLTGYTVSTNALTVLIRGSFTKATGTNRWMFSAGNTNATVVFGIRTQNENSIQFWNGTNFTNVSVSPGTNPETGVFCVAGFDIYRGGVDIGNIASNSSTPNTQLVIGALLFGAGYIQHTTGTVQALAVYNSVLSAGQIATVSAAMAAL